LHQNGEIYQGGFNRQSNSRVDQNLGASIMFHATRVLATVSSLLIIGCAATPSGQTYDSAIGEWEETYTSMSGGTRSTNVKFIDEENGTFVLDNGMDGRIEIFSKEGQRTWRGYAILKSGSDQCPTEKGGSKYWSELVFHFNETYNQYTGNYKRCGDGRESNINGVR
jgi:hypothetical protein